MALVRKKKPLVRKAVAKESAPDSPVTTTSVLKYVPLDQRKPGWPLLHHTVPDTVYVVKGLRVVGFSTDCRTFQLGWSTCGTCIQHVRQCRCAGGVHATRAVVYCYRQSRDMPYPSGIAGYIGLHPDPSVNSRDSHPLWVASPVNPVQDEHGVAGAKVVAAAPKKKLVIRRKGGK